MNRLSAYLLNWLYAEFQKRDSLLLPLRVFIGLGWLRAGLEKLVDPAWHSGDALTQFLTNQVQNGEVAFPFYEYLMTALFVEQSQPLGLLITAGEVYIGIAILCGILTRTSLLAGLFMNGNFLFAGAIDPSAFYIIIQMILLPTRIGHVAGLDSVIEKLYSPTARNKSSKGVEPLVAGLNRKVRLLGIATMLASLFMGWLAPHVQSTNPLQSTDDPAIILLLLSSLTLLLLGILIIQAQKGLVDIGHDNTPAFQSMPTENGFRNVHSEHLRRDHHHHNAFAHSNFSTQTEGGAPAAAHSASTGWNPPFPHSKHKPNRWHGRGATAPSAEDVTPHDEFSHDEFSHGEFSHGEFSHGGSSPNKFNAGEFDTGELPPSFPSIGGMASDALEDSARPSNLDPGNVPPPAPNVHQSSTGAEPYSYPRLDRQYYNQLLQDLCRPLPD